MIYQVWPKMAYFEFCNFSQQNHVFLGYSKNVRRKVKFLLSHQQKLQCLMKKKKKN